MTSQMPPVSFPVLQLRLLGLASCWVCGIRRNTGWDPTAANCSSFLNSAASSAHETGLFPRIVSDGLSLAQWDPSIKNWQSIKEWLSSPRQHLWVYSSPAHNHTHTQWLFCWCKVSETPIEHLLLEFLPQNRHLEYSQRAKGAHNSLL